MSKNKQTPPESALDARQCSALFEKLGKRIFKRVSSIVADGECDELCEEIMEECAKLGLVKRVSFPPDYDFETGWTWEHLPPDWEGPMVTNAMGEALDDPCHAGFIHLDRMPRPYG